MVVILPQVYSEGQDLKDEFKENARGRAITRYGFAISSGVGLLEAKKHSPTELPA